jgi:hypothetical protein
LLVILAPLEVGSSGQKGKNSNAHRRRDAVMAAQGAAMRKAKSQGQEFTLEDARAAGRSIYPTLPVDALDSCYSVVVTSERPTTQVPKAAPSKKKKASKKESGQEKGGEGCRTKSQEEGSPLQEALMKKARSRDPS